MDVILLEQCECLLENRKQTLENRERILKYVAAVLAQLASILENFNFIRRLKDIRTVAILLELLKAVATFFYSNRSKKDPIFATNENGICRSQSLPNGILFSNWTNGSFSSIRS